MSCYDLHSHSTVSDGVLSPSELVQRAAARGVDVLALTDHDATEGIAEATEMAGECGLYLLPGVEISVSWQAGVIHVLGLGIDPDNEQLRQGLSQQRAERVQRALATGECFERLGIKGVFEGVTAQVGGGVICRTHFARYLAAHGHVRDVRSAFQYYLQRGRSCHVPCRWAELDEAVGWILGAGGLAVMAHPARYRMNNALLKALLVEFKEAGGCGIEVISGHTDHHVRNRMVTFANRLGLLASVGSDFHEPNPWNELGSCREFPRDCVPLWRRLNAGAQLTG